MSFEELVDSSKTLKSKAFTIKKADKSFSFTANELSYTRRVKLAGLEQTGEDVLLHWIVLSIKDEAGKHMSIEQAEKLPDEVKERFIQEVFGLNVETEKPVKKKSKRK